LPHYNIEKPEAITFDDFADIQFELGKPQLFSDLIFYLTGTNLFKLLNILPASRQFTRKKSEELIFEANKSS
jgi:hypothetical protein